MLHRSVSCTRWDDPRLDDGDFRADLFSDFRVDEDGLSTWGEPIERAAQVTASAMDRIGTICLLEIPEDLLDEIGIPVDAEHPGDAPDAASASLHRSLGCFGGSRLARLVDRLSESPSCRRFGIARVRQLLASRIGVGVTLEQLEPRVVEDLMRSGLVTRAAGQQALGTLFERNRFSLRRLKLTTVRELVDAGVVPRRKAEVLHPGFQET